MSSMLPAAVEHNFWSIGQFFIDAWTRVAVDSELLYDTKIMRKALLNTQDGTSAGDLKLVWKRRRVRRHGEVLLIMWSPPHTLRGIPVTEFTDFLDKVINHKGKWFSELGGEGLGGERIEKKRRERDMYDANTYIIAKEASCYDASYAEIATHFGPPTIFVSHVWGETADTTRASIARLRDTGLRIDSQGEVSKAGALARSSSNMSLYSLDASVRLWFCTTCNNQNRIDEELGTDILESPFAQVLKAPTCKIVALISPLKALERKWCTFEFSIAVKYGKETLMVTREGVVQAGQVAPKALDELSEKIVDFRCERARASVQRDEDMINAAVESMGGYVTINNKIRDIFIKAICEAHGFTDKARQRLTVGSEALLSAYTAARVSAHSSNEDHLHEAPQEGQERASLEMPEEQTDLKLSRSQTGTESRISL